MGVMEDSQIIKVAECFYICKTLQHGFKYHGACFVR